MNFDDIKSAWDNEDDSSKVVVPDSITKIKAATQPVNKIRSNMKAEVGPQLLALLFMAFGPMFFHLSNLTTVLYYCLYGIMIVISIYYFGKFYLFYNRLTSNVMNTKDHLYEVYYDIKLNIEMYRSFTYALTILVLGFFFVYVLTDAPFAKRNTSGIISTDIMMMVVVLFICVTVCVALVTEWWIKIYYAKYMEEVKTILDQFREN